jgi:glutathione S-transferase
MQQLACHLLSTAATMAASSTTTVSATTSSSTMAAVNYLGQSKVLHLLGPPWTRTFRCIWMLEEINEEYYQQNTKGNDHVGTTPPPPTTTTTATSLQRRQPLKQNIPYYLLYNAKPLSIYVKKFHPTGKVPVLLEYDINHEQSSQQQQQQAQPQQDDDITLTAGNTTVLDDQNVFVLSEASAINTYLYDRYGLYSSINTNIRNNNTADDQDHCHSPLVPPVGSPLRGQYDAIVSCICTELDAQGLWMHRKHDVMSEQLTGSRPNQRAVFHAKEHFKRINTYLAYLCNPYLLGEQFTAADILYIHCLQWSQSIGWSQDTWPTIDVLAPINVDAIKEQLRNTSTAVQQEDPSRSDNDTTSNTPTTTNNNNNNNPTIPPQPPSILQPYLDLCLSRPAYQRAVQIRDGRGNGHRMDSTPTVTTSTTTGNIDQLNRNKPATSITGEVSITTASLLEQWEKEQSHVERRKNYRPPKSRL